MIFICSIIIVISDSYYSKVNLHDFGKHFKFRSMRRGTLHLALVLVWFYRTGIQTVIWSSELECFVCGYVWGSIYHASDWEFKRFCLLKLNNNVDWLNKQTPNKPNICCYFLLSCYYKWNCISTFAFCQNNVMLYTADTGITDYTSSAWCWIVCRLATDGW
jgi:hypothetical protein